MAPLRPTRSTWRPRRSWPRAPPRVLLDERRLLSELLGQPVEVLPAGGDGAEAARRWPVEQWLEPPDAGEPVAAPSSEAVPGAAAIVLEPYGEWEPHAVGDPR